MKTWMISACCYLMATEPFVMASNTKITAQEAVFLRRMTEFWKDRDYSLVKQQIEGFLSSHESSHIHEALYAVMGDILYQEKAYGKALEYYEKIVDASLQEKTKYQKAQCLYVSEEYEKAINFVTDLMEKSSSLQYLDELRFILGDSFFRKMQGESDSTQKEQFALKAKQNFILIRDTAYKNRIAPALAEVHKFFKEYGQAIALYIELANENHSEKEEWLLQAAVLQLEVSPQDALATFQQVVNLRGSRASESAYQELVLLFKNNQFQMLIERYPVLKEWMPDEKKGFLQFCLGHSYFSQDQMLEATDCFLDFIHRNPAHNEYKKSAYIALIECTKKTQNDSLFDQMVQEMVAAFPSDEESAKALLLHAKWCLEKQNFDVASHDLDLLLKNFPLFSDQQTILYDQAVILSKLEKWDESRQTFLSYLGSYPNSAHETRIWASIVNCSIHALKQAHSQPAILQKKQLIWDLEQALSRPDVFTDEERSNYHFLLGQLLFETNEYSKAAFQLNNFCQTYPQHQSLGNAELLQALSHKKLGSDIHLFLDHAEKALALSQSQDQKIALRFQLFNAYLLNQNLSQAANQLYHVFVVDGNPIQIENQRWLTRYYYHESQKGDQIAKERALTIFQKVLKTDHEYQLHFDPSQTYLEEETLHFATMLTGLDKKALLESLLSLQTNHKELAWKNQLDVEFELAKTYVDLQKPIEALEKFDHLLSIESKDKIALKQSALFEKSRLLLSQCRPSDFKEENPTIQHILACFKDLQIQKDLNEEPLHLEAALEYAELRIALSSPESKVDSALFFLNRIKDDFYSKNEKQNEDYHEARLRFPEKDALFQVYMKYLEADILAWEAKRALATHDTEKALRNQQDSRALLEEITQNSHATSYLKKRVYERLNELNNL